MAIVNNRTKTSLFLTLLMILTPFAAASTVTTFSDGSSEVVIEFKDGVNTENTTDGGFYVPSDETITSASVEIQSEPMLFSTNEGERGLVSYTWDSGLNNGATSFDDVSKFEFSQRDITYSASLKSESYASDFESNVSGMTNSTTFVDDLSLIHI